MLNAIMGSTSSRLRRSVRIAVAIGASLITGAVCSLGLAVVFSQTSELSAPPELVMVSAKEGRELRPVEVWTARGMEVVGYGDPLRHVQETDARLSPSHWSRLADPRFFGWELPHYEFGFGWPMICLTWQAGRNFKLERGDWPRGQIVLPRPADEGSANFRPMGVPTHAIPLHLVLTPFLVDSGVNALVMLLAFRVWVRTVRMAVTSRRRRRAQCERCGYDRRGIPAQTPCPECGGVP